MDSRRRQRSIALNHIPPLPIPHGLEYPLGTPMHLCVVHPRLEARGRPFRRSPGSCSRVNPRVLRPLTQGPQGQPSPLRRPHGRPGVQGIFLTSRGQAPHDWPMVHHSIATAFPIPRGCCSEIFCFTSPLGTQPRDISFPCVTSRHASRPIPRVPGLPILPGLLCGPSHTPFSVPSPFPIIPCLYPTGPPATLWRGPTGSSSIQGPFRAPSMGRSLPASFCLGGFFLSGPVGGSTSWACPRFPRYPCLFPTCSPAVVVFFRAPPADPLLHRLLLPVPPLPARSVLYALRRCFLGLFLFFFWSAPPLFLLCILPCGVLPLPRLLVSFYPPPCIHARQHCTGHRVTALLSVRLRSHRPGGVCPLAVPGHAGGASLPLRHSPLFPLLSPLPPPLSCLSPALLLLLSCSVCSPLLFPLPGLYLARCQVSLSPPPVLRPVGRLRRLPQVPLQGDSPVVHPSWPPLHQFPDGRAGRPVRFNAGQNVKLHFFHQPRAGPGRVCTVTCLVLSQGGGGF